MGKIIPVYRGIEFDGVDDYIDCGSATGLDNIAAINNAITISAWINSAGAGDSLYPTIVDKLLLDAGWKFGLSTTNTKVVFYHYCSGNDLDKQTNAIITDNSWYHTLITWDNSLIAANVHIYVNNVEPTYAISIDGTTALQSDAANNLRIGARSATGGEFKGKISEVAIWSAILTASQIALLANSKIKGMPLQIQPAKLVMYLPLDDITIGQRGQSRTFYDLSGNKNHGTGVSGTSGLTSVPIQNVFYDVSSLYLEKKAPYQIVRFPQRRSYLLPAVGGLSIPVAMAIYKQMRN